MMKRSLTLMVAALALQGCAAFSEPVLTVADARLTSQARETRTGKLAPVRRFTQQDVLLWYVSVTWSPADRDGGYRKVETRWFKGDTLVSYKSQWARFRNTPQLIEGRRLAAALGAGHFRVETRIDDQPAGCAEFDILP